MNGRTEALIVFLLYGLPLLFGSYFVGVKKFLALMAGWNPERYIEHEQVALYFGFGLLGAGIIVFVGCILRFLNVIPTLGYFVVASVLILLVCAVIVNIRFKIG